MPGTPAPPPRRSAAPRRWGASAATRSRSCTSTRPRARPDCCRSRETPTSRCRACRRAPGWRPTTRSTRRSTVDRIPLIQTIENTFGIPINHFVITSFNGVIDLVKAVGGINLDFPYPVRDNDDGNNNSGLDITHCGLPDPERQHGAGVGPLALLRVRGPTRVLGVRRQRRPGTHPAPERHHRGRDRQGEVELQPPERQRLPRFDRPRHHQGRRHVDEHDDLAGPAVPRLFRVGAPDLTLPTLGASSDVAGSVEVVQEPAANADDQPVPGHLPETDRDAAARRLRVAGDRAVHHHDRPRHLERSGAGQATTTTTVPGTGPFNPTPC